MDQAFRFLIMAAISYMAFLCVIRLVMGSQYKAKSFLINIIGMITVYGSFIISRYKGLFKLPGYIVYIIIICLMIFLPPLALKMKSDQTLKYFAFGIIAVPVLHLLFSLLIGWGDYLPFIPIPSLWNLLKS